MFLRGLQSLAGVLHLHHFYPGSTIGRSRLLRASLDFFRLNRAGLGSFSLLSGFIAGNFGLLLGNGGWQKEVVLHYQARGSMRSVSIIQEAMS